MKFLQFQAIVQQQRRAVRKCYIAQKTHLSFHAHFDSSPQDKSKYFETSFTKKLTKTTPEAGNRKTKKIKKFKF